MRWFAAPSGAVAMCGLVGTHSTDFAKFAAQPVWVSFFGSGVISAVCAFRTHRKSPLCQGFVAAAATLLMAGTWLVAPDLYVGMAWSAIAVAVLELGFREIAAGAFAVVFCRLLGFGLGPAPMISTPPAIAAIYWFWYRVRNRIVFWLAPIPLVWLLFRTAGGTHASGAYMALALVLLAGGIRFRIRDARLQSYIVAALAFAFAILHRELPPSLATIALLYAGQAIARNSEESKATSGFSIAASTLLAALLSNQVSGGMLTVSWGLEGLALLAAGFRLRESVLRLQGLALLLVCILKLFVYDLRNLETFPRILSFIALGAIMLGVSWIYTRFRNHLSKLL
jgi:hypothetical protein